jgi:hypothetical protein
MGRVPVSRSVFREATLGCFTQPRVSLVTRFLLLEGAGAQWPASTAAIRCFSSSLTSEGGRSPSTMAKP